MFCFCLFFNELKLSENLCRPSGYCFSYEFLMSGYMVNRTSCEFRYLIWEFGIFVFEKDYIRPHFLKFYQHYLFSCARCCAKAYKYKESKCLLSWAHRSARSSRYPRKHCRYCGRTTVGGWECELHLTHLKCFWFFEPCLSPGPQTVAHLSFHQGHRLPVGSPILASEAV